MRPVERDGDVDLPGDGERGWRRRGSGTDVERATLRGSRSGHADENHGEGGDDSNSAKDEAPHFPLFDIKDGEFRAVNPSMSPAYSAHVSQEATELTEIMNAQMPLGATCALATLHHGKTTIVVETDILDETGRLVGRTTQTRAVPTDE